MQNEIYSLADVANLLKLNYPVDLSPVDRTIQLIRTPYKGNQLNPSILIDCDEPLNMIQRMPEFFDQDGSQLMSWRYIVVSRSGIFQLLDASDSGIWDKDGRLVLASKNNLEDRTTIKVDYMLTEVLDYSLVGEFAVYELEGFSVNKDKLVVHAIELDRYCKERWNCPLDELLDIELLNDPRLAIPLIANHPTNSEASRAGATLKNMQRNPEVDVAFDAIFYQIIDMLKIKGTNFIINHIWFWEQYAKQHVIDYTIKASVLQLVTNELKRHGYNYLKRRPRKDDGPLIII